LITLKRWGGRLAEGPTTTVSDDAIDPSAQMAMTFDDPGTGG